MCRARSCDNLEAVIAAHAVIDMHHQSRRGQDFGPLSGSSRLCGVSARRSDEPVAQILLLGNHRHTRRLKPVLQRPYRQMQARALPIRVPSGD